MKLFGLPKLEDLVQNLIGFLETRIDLFKMEAKEELAKGISRFLLFTFFLLTFSLFVIFASITLSLYLNSVFGNTFFGFGIVAIAYLLFFAVLYLTRNAPFWQQIIYKMINYSAESIDKENGRSGDKKEDSQPEE